MVGQRLLQDEDPPTWRERVPTAREQLHARVVVPVVDDRLEHVSIATGRHRVEEVTSDDLDACADPGAFEDGPRVGDDDRKIEQHPGTARVRGEDGGEQRARPTTDIADPPPGRPRVRVSDHVLLEARRCFHRVVEQTSRVGVDLGEVAPEVVPDRRVGRGAAGAHRVVEPVPDRDVPRRTEEARPRPQRARMGVAQQRRCPVVAEASVAPAPEHAASDEVPEEAIDRVGVDIQCRRELRCSAASVAEHVRDSQLGGNPECLGVDDPEAALEDRDRGGRRAPVDARDAVAGRDQRAYQPRGWYP